MHPEKMASLILIAVAVLFIMVAVIFQSQDIGSCPSFITGQNVTCTIDFPGTNIPIEPTVRILVTLSITAFGTGASIFLISRHYRAKNPSGATPNTVR
jgi:membrane-bound ClpP family serine protease